MLISNGSGKAAVATTTSTELGYVSGLSSNIQIQLTSCAFGIPQYAGYGGSTGT